MSLKNSRPGHQTVLYDHQIFGFQRVGGASRYFAELHRNIEAKTFESVIPNYYSDNIFLEHKRSLPCLSRKSFRGKSRLYTLLNERITRRILRDRHFDVLHPTYFDPYIFDIKNDSAVVVTVHDMIHELFPEAFSARGHGAERKKAECVERADALIAVSHQTKADLVRLLKVSPEKVHVIHHGSSIHENSPAQEFAVPKQYLLFVGVRAGYKNFSTFFKVIQPLLKKNPDLYLFCVGGGAFQADELEMFRTAEVGERVIQKSLSEPELIYAYRNAACFIFPSLYEGFGMTILEAFSLRCPIVLPRLSCFPEIAGDAGLFYESNEELLSQVERCLTDRASVREKIELGSKRVLDFNWKKTAEETCRVYSLTSQSKSS